ncbi:hypothetical protein [Tenacibaculum soleae]|uniref:hypothetical protein n=1 Tax=Tenacibaculum soleae TaxID=447689 RepID=UPI0022FFC73A|nr:hypothetical protein [Tenacibaculum soleae]
MKKYFLLLLLTSFACFAQEDIKFKKGVNVVENKKAPNFKTPKSILFTFEGDTHLINYYLILTKKLKKKARKNKITVGFKYNLQSVNPLNDDLSSIPKSKEDDSDYVNTCIVSCSFPETPKAWGDFKYVKKRKTKHYVNFKMVDNKNKEVFSTKFDVHALYTIATESKKTSEMFFNLISAL